MNDLVRIRKLIKQGEGTRLEWKDSRILSNSFKLARSMVAMANKEGGLILIGVRDDGSIEEFEGRREHEEWIMNVSANNCDPPISTIFQRVKMSKKGEVYMLTILKRRKGTFHGVKTKEGLVYFVRAGSTIREMRPHELSGLAEVGVEIPPYAPSERGLLWLSRKILTSVAARLKVSPLKGMLVLVAVGLLLIFGALLLLFRIENGQLRVLNINYPLWMNMVIIVWLVLGAFLSVSMPTVAFKTRCPDCKSFFSYKRNKTVVLDKRTVDENTEEWTVVNDYRCENCGYEEQKTEYERCEPD